MKMKALPSRVSEKTVRVFPLRVRGVREVKGAGGVTNPHRSLTCPARVPIFLRDPTRTPRAGHGSPGWVIRLRVASV